MTPTREATTPPAQTKHRIWPWLFYGAALLLVMVLGVLTFLGGESTVTDTRRPTGPIMSTSDVNNNANTQTFFSKWEKPPLFRSESFDDKSRWNLETQGTSVPSRTLTEEEEEEEEEEQEEQEGDDVNDSDSDVTMDGFLSSLYINLFAFVVLMVVISVLRKWMPEFFHPRSYSVDDEGSVFRMELPENKTRHDGQGPPPIPEKWFGFYWIYFIATIPLKTVLDTVGLDAYMFMRFCQRAGQLFGIVCTILGCGVILPINMDHGDGTQGRFESVTLANVPEGRKILWVHAVSVWLFTFATFAILLELGREFAYLRHRYLRYNIYHRTTQPTAERQSIDDEQRVNSPVDAHAHEEVSSSLEVKVSPHLPSTTAAEDSQISSAVADERLSSSAVRFESSDPQPDMLPPWVINTTELEPNAPFVLNPRPYTIMVENLPSWINCDTQLYFYFDNLFPGLVHSVSLVQLAEGVDKAYSERNSALRLLEKRDRLQKKYENSKVSNMHKGDIAEKEFDPPDRSGDIYMVLYPKWCRWFVDLVCCGPFYDNLFCGCYRKCCSSCDDGGEYEDDVIRELGVDAQNGEDASGDGKCDSSPHDENITIPNSSHPKAHSGCCQQAKKVHAQRYLKAVLQVKSERLQMMRSRAASQIRRRSSEDRTGAPSDDRKASTDVHDSANAASTELTSIRVENTDPNDDGNTSVQNESSLECSKAECQTKDPVIASQRTVGAKSTNVGKTMYDRVAFTTEVLTGVDWRTRFNGVENANGFRPSSTGFVTFRSIVAVSVALQLDLVAHRAVLDPGNETNDRINNSSETVQLVRAVTSRILSPCNAMLQVMDVTRYRDLEVKRAPGPEDIQWNNVTVKEQLRQSRKWTTFWLTLLLQVFYTVLVSAVASLVTLDNLSTVLPGLGKLAEENSFLKGLITGLLPTLIIEGMLALLPIVFKWFGYLEYLQTHSELQLSASAKFFQFKTWQLMFVFLISGTLFDTINDIVKEPAQIPKILGVSLPRMSSFYVNLLMLRTLTILPLQMLRPVKLILHYFSYRRDLIVPSTQAFRRASGKRQPGTTGVDTGLEKPKPPKVEHTWQLWKMTRRHYWESILLSAGDFSWVHHFTNCLLPFLMGMAYSSINPVIAPVAASFFWIASFAWKYLLLYVYRKSWETGGLIWPKMVRRISVSLVVYQLTMLGILGLKQSPSTALILPLPFLTWLFDSFVYKHLELPAMRLSKDESNQIDRSHTETEDIHLAEGKPCFSSIDSLRRTQFPPLARVQCPYSAYLRPSLDPSNDWEPHKLSTRSVLYF